MLLEALLLVICRLDVAFFEVLFLKDLPEWGRASPVFSVRLNGIAFNSLRLKS